VQIQQLIHHRRNERRFAAAAKSRHRQTQMAINTAVHQRVEFVFKSLHRRPSLRGNLKCMASEYNKWGQIVDYQFLFIAIAVFSPVR
jgi:hypothetical protein